MKRLRLRAALMAGLLAASTGGMVTAVNLATTHPASADPAAASAYVGVGSDTIQDLMDAYSGADPYPGTSLSSATKYYIPLQSSSATGFKTVVSWDAIPAGGSASAPGCITAKYGGTTFDRPNGSSNGIAALSHAIDGTAWFASTASCTGSGAPAGNVNGQIDFARSSRGPNAGTSPCTASLAANCLDFIPFARDAVGFAYFDHGTGNAKNLTESQLNQLYGSATGTITLASGDTLKACLSQSGSGTTKFFEGAISVTDAQAEAASAASGCTANPSLLEENGGNSFYTFASGLPAGTDAVVDFSAGSWISQANGVALDRSATARTNGVDMGSLTNGSTLLGVPYTGTAPNEAPNTNFYTDTTFGRNLFVVAQQSKINIGGDAGLRSLFNGSTASICSTTAQNTAHSFGFDSLTGTEGTCGTPQTANLYS